MSLVHHSQTEQPDIWTNDGLEGGIVDLYARRMAAVAARKAEVQQEALDRIVVTQPFGRPFTAQPSFPPDLDETPGGLARLRRKLAGTAEPRRKLATS